MRLSNNTQRTLSIIAAVSWLIVPLAFGTATVLDRSQPWEDSPQQWFVVGWVALTAAGALTTLAVTSNRGERDRPRLHIAGVVAMILGVAVTVAMGWAVPMWTAAFGVGLVLLVISDRAEPSTWLMAGAFVAATVAFFAITALEVGTPDTYGDYPAAWATATIIATVGAALGLLWRGANLPSEKADPVPVA